MADSQNAGRRKHIVWFVADQLRSDALGCFGNPAASTPYMDALAEEGAAFSNAYCQNPVCVPSRCSFLTGWYPHTLGHRTMHHMMREDDPDILKTMRAAGYEVVWAGRNDYIPGSRSMAAYCDHYFDGIDLNDHATEPGSPLSEAALMGNVAPTPSPIMEGFGSRYSFYLGTVPDGSFAHTYDANCVSAVMKFLDEYTGDKPLFIYCTLVNPHPPFICEERHRARIDVTKLPPRRDDVEKLSQRPAMLTGLRERQSLSNWGEDQWDELRANYLGMVANFDEQLGRLVDKLRERGIYDDTTLFVFSDHGEYAGDYGVVEKAQNTFEDPLSKVPLIVKPTAGIPCAPGVNDALVELVDLPATTADLAGTKLDYSQYGVSLLDAIAGGSSPHDAVFCEGGRLPGEEPAMEEYRGPEFMYWPRQSLQHSDGPAHLKASMVRMGNLKYVWRMAEDDELYDLSVDPLELDNRIDDPAYETDVARLRERLLRHHIETADFVPSQTDGR